MQNVQNQKRLIDSYAIAQFLKYKLQYKNIKIENAIPLPMIKAKAFQQKYHAQINKLIKIVQSFENFDVYKYLSFFVDNIYKNDCDIKTLVSTYNFTQYKNYLEYLEKQERIYGYFMKSVNNIVNDCKQLQIFSAKDYLRYLIQNKKLSQYYVSGRISCYFFAAIPKFKMLIDKLDPLTRSDFRELYNMYEMYNAEIVKVFLKKTNKKINPLAIVNQAL